MNGERMSELVFRLLCPPETGGTRSEATEGVDSFHFSVFTFPFTLSLSTTLFFQTPDVHLAGKAADGGDAGCRVVFKLAQFLCSNGM